jgi:hypothetical protein
LCNFRFRMTARQQTDLVVKFLALLGRVRFHCSRIFLRRLALQKVLHEKGKLSSFYATPDVRIVRSHGGV